MKKVIVDKNACIGCGACMASAGEIFGYGPEGESVPLVETVEDNNKDAINAMEGCPTSAISLVPVDAEEKKNCQCENCECDDCDCEDCDCEDCQCDDCERAA